MWYRFLLIIIIFVTASGNILVCLAIARERKLQNTTNYFLMSLAIADCLVAVLVMPMGMISEVLGHFPLPHYACIIFATMDVLCCTSSIWHMSTMSMDRYFTIRFPFRYGRNKTRRVMLLKIVAVWAISAAVSSPVFVLGVVNKENVLSNGVCAPNNASFKIYGSVFAFYIPFLIMIITYALTMRSLRNVLVNKKKYNRERSRKQTFFPLASIINQYAEIAQNIRRTSSSVNQGSSQTIGPTVNDRVQSSPNTSNFAATNKINNNSIPKRSSYVTSPSSTTVPTTSTTTTANLCLSDQRSHQINRNQSELDSTPNSNYGHFSVDNIDFDNNENRLNPQNLTVRQQKLINKRRRRLHDLQKMSTMNSCIVLPVNDFDMSTLYEITEISKSTSSAHEMSTLTGINSEQNLITTSEQQKQSEALSNNDEVISLSNTSTNLSAAGGTGTTVTVTTTESTINMIPSVEEEQLSLTTDVHSPIKKIDSNEDIQVHVSSFDSSQGSASPSFHQFWTDHLLLVRYVLQYYLFVHPYRPCPLSIEFPSRPIDSGLRDTISKRKIPKRSATLSFFRRRRSIATQTSVEFSPEQPSSPTVMNESSSNCSANRKKSLFNRTLLPSTSLFSNIFRQSSNTNIRPTESSNSRKRYSSCQTHSIYLRNNDNHNNYRHRNRHHHQHSYRNHQHRNHQSSVILCQAEPDFEQVLIDAHHPHASSSSSNVSQSIIRLRHENSSNQHFPSRRRAHYQSHPSYSTSNPSKFSQRQRQAYASATNTISSDSSSAVYRFNPRFFSTIYNPSQSSSRFRDEHTVAANERKALRVLMIIFCVFVTLWTPFFICTFITAICVRCREKISSNVWFSITWLGYSSSMANPFIYTIFSDAFRRAFANILCCRSNSSLFGRHFSTRLSNHKGNTTLANVHHQISYRRSPHKDFSTPSTPLTHYQQTQIAGSDATIFINRCTSDNFR